MTNRLAQSPSLYLQKHAENPIDWWPWSEEALEIARRENKPIFLSVGYSSCHWCTVMEGEAFSDPAIAQYMNANFLPIKVDREERPDLDSIYMQALQMMTGQGGWPLNVFLDPSDRIPFYGGTYFPVEPRYGRPGFLQILQAIRRYYDQEGDKVQSVKAELHQLLQESAQIQPIQQLSDGILAAGIEYNTGVIAAEGYGQSFPMIPYAALALQGMRFGFESRYDAHQACTQRGLNLALGGIYDHVAGGFHRYTVDATWTVPHFEKMLYDNGQIMEYLANLWSAGIREPAFERAIAGTVAWLKREMAAPQGYFYAAQDADSFANPVEAEPEEGAFYVWNYEKLEQLITSEELQQLQASFTVTADGNFEGAIVLQRQQPGALPESVEAALAKLFQVRYGALPESVATFPPARNNQDAKTLPWPGRIPPVTDPKMIVAWNSLMISGLARACGVFLQSDSLDLACQVAQFILDQQWMDGRFRRLNYNGQPEVLAQSEDYALFIKALLDLQQVSLVHQPEQAAAWLEQAIRVQAEFDQFLWSQELGGYYNTARDASDNLLIRERSYMDSATPAANGIAIANLVRLFLLTERLPYLEQAETTLTAFGSVMEQSPRSCPSLISALDWYYNGTLVRTTADQLAALVPRHLPTVVLKLELDLPKGVVGLVCQGLTCQEPARTPEQLQEQVLAQSKSRVA
jgi:uncharacterized protein YyaL (SSP411 family)